MEEAQEKRRIAERCERAADVADQKYEKTIVCALYFLQALDRSTGRYEEHRRAGRSTQEASAVPISMSTILTAGLPLSVPLTCIPPVMVKRAQTE